MTAPRLRRFPAAALAAALAALVPFAHRAAPAQEPRKIALDAFLRGAITSFDGSSVEVHYDLLDPAQLDDFTDYKAFQVVGSWKRAWFDRSLSLEGTGSVIWKPVLRKRVEMEFDARLRVARDFGAYIAEDRPTDHLSVFSIYDQYFQNKDTPGSQKVHMICRFLPSTADSGGDFAFRYVIRKPGPTVPTQKAVRVRLGREGPDEWLEIDGQRMTGNENQWPALRGYRPGLYVIDSGAWVSNIVVRGELEPKWAAEAGVDLALPVKVRAGAKQPERQPTAADQAAALRIQAVRNGAEGATAIVKLLEDSGLVDATREDAAKAMEEANDLRTVPRLVTLMESPDSLTRKLSGRVVSKLTGKSFGYSPDGPEEARHRAVRSLLDWIEKNPGKFR